MMSTIRDHMTPNPHTIGADQSVEEALQRMRKFRIRHLPVLRGGELVGILSDRDVRLIEGFASAGQQDIMVAEAMSPEAFATDADADLGDVVSRMASQRLGSAVVMERGQVVGIFTTTDALSLLARRLAD